MYTRVYILPKTLVTAAVLRYSKHSKQCESGVG